jgi:rhodanese-related sulfurtransferase
MTAVPATGRPAALRATHSLATWQTTLFTSSRRHHGVALSPRAAFQAALHGRALLVDLRSADARQRDGELPAYLLAGDSEREGGRPAYRLSSRPAPAGTPAVIALDEHGDLPHGTPHVAGGFRAWRAAGMPTVTA